MKREIITGARGSIAAVAGQAVAVIAAGSILAAGVIVTGVKARGALVVLNARQIVVAHVARQAAALVRPGRVHAVRPGSASLPFATAFVDIYNFIG